MLYFEAANVIDEVKKKNGSVKSLVFGGKYKNKKQLFALVCETLKYSSLIDKIIAETRLLQQEKFLRKNRTLAQIVVYEQLFGKGIQCGGRLKAGVKGHKTALQAALSRMKIKAKVTENEDLLPKEITQQVQLPRYVRVNLLKTTMKDVIEHFIKEGYTLTSRKDQMCAESMDAQLISEISCKRITSLKRKHFMVDLHLPDVLVFAAKSDLHDHVLYHQGDIILQDKASCMPAQVLSPTHGSHVIDACAAPGNKTTHLASIMNNTGKIFAFDLDAKRLGTMGGLTMKAGVMNAQLHNQDFLKTDPNDPKYKKVEYVLVDPSCSGSGIVNRKDYLTENSGDESSKSKERIEALARFQLTILKHALKFPNVKRLVYSTCSVHVEENEEVVEKVLEQNTDFVLGKPLPSWAHRGVEGSKVGLYCLRASPEQDKTNGFFVALFERKVAGVKGQSTDNKATVSSELDSENGSPETVKGSTTDIKATEPGIEKESPETVKDQNSENKATELDIEKGSPETVKDPNTDNNAAEPDIGKGGPETVQTSCDSEKRSSQGQTGGRKKKKKRKLAESQGQNENSKQTKLTIPTKTRTGKKKKNKKLRKKME